MNKLINCEFFGKRLLYLTNFGSIYPNTKHCFLNIKGNKPYHALKIYDVQISTNPFIIRTELAEGMLLRSEKLGLAIWEVQFRTCLKVVNLRHTKKL